VVRARRQGTLGSSRFQIAAGGQQLVTVRLRPGAQHALPRTGSLLVTIVIRSTGAGSSTRKAKLRA
jgi:hypothetical protein